MAEVTNVALDASRTGSLEVACHMRSTAIYACMSHLAPLLLGALLVGVVWRMGMGMGMMGLGAAVLVTARACAGPRRVVIRRPCLRRPGLGVVSGLSVLVLVMVLLTAAAGAIFLLFVHNSQVPLIILPGPFFPDPSLLFFLPRFQFPAPRLLNALRSHWACMLRNGRRVRGSSEQGMRLSAAPAGRYDHRCSEARVPPSQE